MQPIERYGLVALLFLIVTVVAVVLWDKKSDKDKAKLPAATTSVVAPNGVAQGPELGGGNAPPVNGAPLYNGAAATGGASEVVDGAPRPLAITNDAQAPAHDLNSLNSAAAQAPVAVQTPTPSARTSADATEPLGGGVVQRPTVAGTYTVKKGDTLSSIAKSQLGAASRHTEIAALNPGLDPKRMKVGQTLKMPGGASVAKAATTSKSAPKAAPAKSAPAAAGASYTVRRGESLWTIAQAQLGDGDRFSEIAALNPQIDPNRLIVGAKLRMPATATRAPQAASIGSVASRTAVAANAPRRGGVL